MLFGFLMENVFQARNGHVHGIRTTRDIYIQSTHDEYATDIEGGHVFHKNKEQSRTALLLRHEASKEA